jgi:Family of unknown function (DUF6455)
MPAERQSQRIYMREMMERLGLDPAEGVVPHFSLSYATALRRCAACPSRQACCDWLNRMPASMNSSPRFCPNADIYFELQFDHLGRAHPAVGGAPTRRENREGK